MRSIVLVLLVLAPGLALAGCAAEDTPGPTGEGPPGDDREEPPTSTPARRAEQTTVWGRLVQREPVPGTNATELTVQAELLDCERVDQRVTRRVDLSGLGDLAAPEPPLSREEMNEVRSRYNRSGFTTTDPAELEHDRLYLFVWNGTDASPDREPYVTRSPAVFVAYHEDNGTVELSSARYPEEEPNLFLGDPEDPNRRTFQAAKRPWVPEDIEENERYLFDLSRTDDGEPWSLARIGQERPDLDQRCRHEHADDLSVQGPQRAMAFPANETRRVELAVANSQDEALELSIQRVHLINETAYAPHLPPCPEGEQTANESRPGPPGGEEDSEEQACAQTTYQERRQRAIVEDCRAEPETASLEVAATSNGTLAVEVTCRRTITETQAEHLWLWGTATFTDELGLEHTLGQDRYERWAAFEDVQRARAEPAEDA